MFEKSLYELIRGLRHQKGNEKDYIQASLRECRNEVKSQDMSLKATALLKLTYLEMFGYDMTWASFHVLEVMSSAQYAEKRVGYLAAIQSFRPDTEVLMLAENLLKKDLMSATPTTIALPLVAIPHVISPSMANSLLGDILPRLTHSHAAIRKKTIVTLYRLALVYPETLRPAWPKLKDRLLDEEEDPSVTSAIVNVICELGWRRPQDFLPLAPRLFDLLVEGGNNWMAIKIIKLFATLTPLEPRLVKKLLPPLTSIIKSTMAMSLLYEAIHGIIEGGIMASVEGTPEGEELAHLCVGKLRNMVLIEGDSNLKFVALLTFEKIVISHPYMVSLHQDVILECVDDADISIRMRALNLVVGMVNSDNIVSIVNRLMNQLLNNPRETRTEPAKALPRTSVDHYATSEDEDGDAEESLTHHEAKRDDTPSLPDEYRVQVIRNILDMCAKDTYGHLTDFEWYIKVLVNLVKVCPMVKSLEARSTTTEQSYDISYDIGAELQNVAVRVQEVRSEATIAAQSLVLIENRGRMFPCFSNGGQGVLEGAGWLVGEYASNLTDPEGTLNSLLHSSTSLLPENILSVYIQSMLKVLAILYASYAASWTPQNRTNTILLTNRAMYFLEPLTNHNDMEVQELAVEYLELMKLSTEAASAQAVSHEGQILDAPLLITQAIPAFFRGQDLRPVAVGAQRKVEAPEDLDLDTPINVSLPHILRAADDDPANLHQGEVDDFYYNQEEVAYESESASERLDLAVKPEAYSYQNGNHEKLDSVALARQKAERRARNKDDPFYIGDAAESSPSSRLDNIIKSSYGDDIDLDSIPIMELNLEGSKEVDFAAERAEQAAAQKRRKEQRKKVKIIADETLGGEDDYSPDVGRNTFQTVAVSKSKRSLLDIDSSGLGSLSLHEGAGAALEIEQREEEAKALKEVERLRLEMQRAAERIQAKEEIVVKRKKKKSKSAASIGQELQEDGEVSTVANEKKKKKKKKTSLSGLEEEADADETITKRKKKRQARIVELSDHTEFQNAQQHDRLDDGPTYILDT